MPTKSKRVELSGSERRAVPGARAAGPVDPDERFEVTVRLRSKTNMAPLIENNALDDVLPKDRHYLSQAEITKQHGADPADIEKVSTFASQQGLFVVATNADQRSLVLSGTAGAFQKAFGVKLTHYEGDDGDFRGRTGSITIPAELEGIIEGVFGLDDRPQAQPHFQRWPGNDDSDGGVDFSASTSASFTPLQIAQLYHFPPGLDGTGQCIGIIELGGGYRTKDIKAYFNGLGLPAPVVKTVRVGGGKNQPSTADSADGEVMLDIEVAAAVAPKAKIVVYFAPNTSKGFMDAINQAIHDPVNKPSVISISWGSPESNWTGQLMNQFNQIFQTAAALGVTICVAAGDNGSSDGVSDGSSHVDFPSSSPYSLGCGGTKLFGSGSTISSETVWNEGPNSATGGGVSKFFPIPSYQASVNLPGTGSKTRGVPDVAGDADPATGYQVRVDGQNFVIGGTSAVAPLWAGLIALLNQKLGKPVGFLNPLIYGSLAGKDLFSDIVSGNNGAYSAQSGWYPCTGWGSPVGDRLLTALGG